jgi:hypothetical protein
MKTLMPLPPAAEAPRAPGLRRTGAIAGPAPRGTRQTPPAAGPRRPAESAAQGWLGAAMVPSRRSPGRGAERGPQRSHRHRCCRRHHAAPQLSKWPAQPRRPEPQSGPPLRAGPAGVPAAHDRSAPPPARPTTAGAQWAGRRTHPPAHPRACSRPARAPAHSRLRHPCWRRLPVGPTARTRCGRLRCPRAAAAAAGRQAPPRSGPGPERRHPGQGRPPPLPQQRHCPCWVAARRSAPGGGRGRCSRRSTRAAEVAAKWFHVHKMQHPPPTGERVQRVPWDAPGSRRPAACPGRTAAPPAPRLVDHARSGHDTSANAAPARTSPPEPAS